MLEYINCNLCGSNNFKILFPVDSSTYIGRCKDCGLVFRNPRVLESEILREISLDRIICEHEKKAWFDSKIHLFKSNLKRLERYIPNKGRLLDLGCGYGIFLKMAKDRGWQVEGIEIAQSALRYAQEVLGLKVYGTTLKEVRFPDKYFDVVTLWEVLGQLYDPQGTLKEINRILKPEGLIALRLHNADFHVSLQLLLERLNHPEKKLGLLPTVFHNYNFSPLTIKLMLKEAGFQEIKIYVSEFTKGDPYGSAGIFGDKVMRLIKVILFYLSQIIYYISFKRWIIAPSFLVFARKPKE
ncbi:MAG: class I SAM-dependent methyltransferase [Candidatus Omnitrophica bacterium]|nr:class I SAM-dependent methyltransferase [Candidatus Omnitrophota bacterium]